MTNKKCIVNMDGTEQDCPFIDNCPYKVAKLEAETATWRGSMFVDYRGEGCPGKDEVNPDGM